MSTKIEEYVKEGVTKVVEMRRLNEIFVKNDIFGGEELPDQNIRRFYPRSNVIRSAMCCTIKSLRKSMIDQECLMAKIEQWKTEDSSALLFSSKMCEKKITFRQRVNQFRK